MMTGALKPEEITHCFVLKGFDLAWSMLEGVRCPVSGKLEKSKDIENRHTRLAPGWYGVILGKGTKGVTHGRWEDCKNKLVGMNMPPWKWKELDRYMGCVVGVVKIAHSLPYELCKDSPWAEGPVCNIIEYSGWLGKPIPCKGNLGACPIQDEETRRQVRTYAEVAWRDGDILSTGAEKRFPYRGPSIWPHAKRKPAKGCVDLRDKDDVGKMMEFLQGAQERLQKRQRKGDICLPVANGEEGSWTQMGSTDGVFKNMLDASTAGIENLFGVGSTSSIALLNAANDRGLSSDPAKAWDNFNILQSTSEFDMDAMVTGGLWGWLLKVLGKCGGAFSTGPILYTGLRNASSTMVNRAVETKQDGIPTWIWNDKVRLPSTYSCSSVYNNNPMTLLAYDNVTDRCLRDRYKVIYVEGFYKAPHSAMSIANEINDIVMTKLRSVSGLLFESAMDGCPGTLSGILCPLWLAYMNATLITHAGPQWIGTRGQELTVAMSDWLYEGFHVDLFGYNNTAKSRTLQAAETLLCFYAQAARDSLAAGDTSAAQTRWLQAAAARNSDSMNSLWNYDSVATESLHNSLALGFQGAVGSTHALLDMWRQQQAGVISPGQLACNQSMRHDFLRESLRRSSPGVPTMFATTIDGEHTMLHGSGSNQIRFKGGQNHVNLAAHSISHRHKMEWDNPNGFDMNRAALKCPFAKMAAYNPDVAHGGCGRALTEEPDALFAGTDPATLSDTNAHPFCKDFNEQNIFLIKDSANYDLTTWHTSNNGYVPFGIGYRRCPGENLMWHAFDNFIRDIDLNYNLHLLYPVDDAGNMERWALGTVPKNGLRVRLEEVSRTC